MPHLQRQKRKLEEQLGQQQGRPRGDLDRLQREVAFLQRELAVLAPN
mgnify:CR=1 FL=1